jgi:uncharacterized protein with HEPN domain
MSKRVPSVVLNDILYCIELYCIEHIELYTGNLSYEDFTSNFMVIEASLYNIQIIGTDLPVVWNVIRNDLPSLKSDLVLIRKGLLEEGR